MTPEQPTTLTRRAVLMGVEQAMRGVIDRCSTVERGQTTFESVRNEIGRIAEAVARLAESERRSL